MMLKAYADILIEPVQVLKYPRLTTIESCWPHCARPEQQVPDGRYVFIFPYS
jgi:hypothetical protein